MKIPLYQVDSFTSKVFSGNPACVVPLNEWLEDTVLLKIAQENAVAETAFFVETENGFHLRWFTPDLEMDLCGHATLAAAFIIKTELNYSSKEIHFQTISGELKVLFLDGRYILDFPSRVARPTELPIEIKKALNIQPLEVYKSRDFLLVYDSQEQVEQLKIDRTYFDQINLGVGGVIVTAAGSSVDFVSRFFTPQATILEDPVTGSAHCSLIPYWSSKLGKRQLEAVQISSRGGKLQCTLQEDRVLIGGQAVLYSRGECYLKD